MSRLGKLVRSRLVTANVLKKMSFLLDGGELDGPQIIDALRGAAEDLREGSEAMVKLHDLAWEEES